MIQSFAPAKPANGHEVPLRMEIATSYFELQLALITLIGQAGKVGRQCNNATNVSYALT